MLVITPWNDVNLSGDDGIVFVLDHQPPCADWKIDGDLETGSVYQDQSYNNIEKIIKDHKIDVEHVYMDHYLHWKDFPYPHTCIPRISFLAECDIFLESAITEEYSDKHTCFIMMNKQRENRLLVSAWFSQNSHIDFEYTQGWNTQDKDFLNIQEYTRLTHYKLDSFLDKKFIPYPSNLKFNTYQTNTTNSPGGDGCVFLWNNIFKEKFCYSTFSIITEPTFWEKGCSITEKYVMTLYGCCFPIFCGGYGLADQLMRIGFDVFDDIINHSYQYETHPGLRVLNALEFNRELLESHNIKKLDYMDRHLKNLYLIRENLDNFKNQFDNPYIFKKLMIPDGPGREVYSQFERYLSSL